MYYTEQLTHNVKQEQNAIVRELSHEVPSHKDTGQP